MIWAEVFFYRPELFLKSEGPLKNCAWPFPSVRTYLLCPQVWHGHSSSLVFWHPLSSGSLSTLWRHCAAPFLSLVLDSWWFPILVCLGCYTKKIINNRFVSQFLEARSPGQGADRFCAYEGLLSGSQHLLAVSSHSGRSKAALLGHFNKGTNPIPRTTPSWPNPFPKAPPLTPSHWILGFNIWIWGGHRHSNYSVARVPLLSHLIYWYFSVLLTPCSFIYHLQLRPILGL